MVLRSLYMHGPLVNRQKLSELTGLSSATISTLITELIAEGIVVEAGTVESDGGRPRVLLSIDPDHGYVIGVDVGETRIRLDLFDMQLTGLAKAEFVLAPGLQTPEVVVERILTGVRGLAVDAGIGEERILGIGIGVPGVVSRSPEPMVDAPTCGWKSVPLGALLGAGTSVPLHIENGAKSHCQAELWFGAGLGSRHLFVALLGTGLGAAIVTDGSIYRGVSSSAGEWGHTVVERDGRSCRCGRRGCLEAYVGAGAILERFREAEPSAAQAGADEETALSAMLALAEAGDPSAGKVLAETADWLGLGIGNMINLFNPERLLLGGWAGSLLAGSMLEDIRAAAARHALAAPFAQVTIAPGALGPDAVALGAAIQVIDAYLEG